MKRLTPSQVKSITKVGFYRVADTLYLKVKDTKRKQWIQRVTIGGRRRDLGLGAYPVTDTMAAMEKALANLRAIQDGKAPVIVAKGSKNTLPFADAAKEAFAVKRTTWKNDKDARRWYGRLETYAFPTLGKLPVATIEVDDVLKVLRRIWVEKNPTARLVKVAIGDVLAYCHEVGHVSVNVAENLKGVSLPKVKHVKQNFDSLPPSEVPTALQAIKGIGSKPVKGCLEFIIHTACRQHEARGATWQEIDFDNALWNIPANRMKNGKAHSVPLAAQVLELLDTIKAQASPHASLIFPSKMDIRKEQSDSTMRRGLEAAGLKTTVHGFRGSFSTWANESDYDYRHIEIALSHEVGNEVERAYNKAKMVMQRRDMMQDWSNYLAGGAE